MAALQLDPGLSCLISKKAALIAKLKPAQSFLFGFSSTDQALSTFSLYKTYAKLRCVISITFVMSSQKVSILFHYNFKSWRFWRLWRLWRFFAKEQMESFGNLNLITWPEIVAI